MPGIQGQSFDFQVKFYDAGVLFDPFEVQDVNIFDIEAGGIPIATVTPVQVSTGIWRGTWIIPITQPIGIYYDEWTWIPELGGPSKTQRYEFEVLKNDAVPSDPCARKCVKVKGKNKAVGWWGRHIYKRIENEQIPSKIRALLQDKLLSRGKDVYLWNQVTESTLNSIICSCVKDTTDRADTTCNSCYGTKLIPGYNRFFFENLYLASTSGSTTLVDTHVDTNIKPNRIVLNDLSLTGTFKSDAIPYINILNFDWETKTDALIAKDTNTILVEFSTDDVNFYDISDINGINKPIGTGNIYIRVTLARTDLTHRSPEFEILRFRHKTRVEPYIKILRPQIMQNPSIMQYGRRTEQMGERFWTMPLDFFDCDITQDTPEAQIVENSFYELVKGINTGIRYVTTKLNYNEEFGIFTQQSFEARRTQPEEFYNKLVF